jgi:hypothetical protein
MHNEKLVYIRNQIHNNQVTVEHLKFRVIDLKIPLANAITQRNSLNQQIANWNNVVMALIKAKA